MTLASTSSPFFCLEFATDPHEVSGVGCQCPAVRLQAQGIRREFLLSPQSSALIAYLLILPSVTLTLKPLIKASP